MKITKIIFLCCFLVSCAPVMQGPVTPGPSGGTMGPMEYYMDRFGSDYNIFDPPQPDPQLCQDACQNDPNCVAWTYVKPGFQGPNPHCCLKNAIPPLTPNPYCVSGVKVAVTPSGEGGQPPPEQQPEVTAEPPSTGPSGGTMGPMEYNMDRMGSDYSHVDLSQSDPQLCQDACQNDPNCVAWTYVKPGFQGPNPRCWLKNAIPPITPNPYCVSGVKVAVTPGQPQSE